MGGVEYRRPTEFISLYWLILAGIGLYMEVFDEKSFGQEKLKIQRKEDVI